MKVTLTLTLDLPGNTPNSTVRTVLADALDVARKRTQMDNLSGRMVRRHSTLGLTSVIVDMTTTLTPTD